MVLTIPFLFLRLPIIPHNPTALSDRMVWERRFSLWSSGMSLFSEACILTGERKGGWWEEEEEATEGGGSECGTVNSPGEV